MAGASDVLAEARGVWKRFTREWVLRDLDLTLCRGEVVVVAGPNGAGKTTLLRLLAGLTRPTRGIVQRRGRVGFLASPPAFHRHLSAEEHLLYALRLEGLPAERREALRVLDAMELPPHRRVGAFSSGMRKRLALARLIVLHPELWLLDEPETALDPGGRRLLESLIAGGRAERATLLATHDLAWGRSLATRLLELGR